MMSLELALECASRGWQVFPVRDKKPLVKWKMGACTDEDTIRRWWSTTFPDADVAIATGSRSNLVVIDDDRRKHGLNPFHPPYPTYCVPSKNLGTHFYYSHPGTCVRNSVSSLDEHVDVRGDGGYVVCRTVNANVSLAPYPSAFLGVKAKVRVFTPGGTNWTEHINGWPIGQRNNMLFKAACVLFDADCDRGINLLGAAAISAGLSEEEVVRTLRSAEAKVKGNQ